jgi:tetratricopeptide (TPR) repeat protein
VERRFAKVVVLTRKALPPVLLLAVFAGLAVASVRGSSVTGDEVAHLPAGYTYVRTGDFRLNPQHPPLIKALAGLPLLALDLDAVEGTRGWAEADEWTFGKAFLTRNRQPLRRIAFLARLPMIAVGVLLGALLFAWAREMWGYGPALFVLLLYAFCPNLLAHTALVTTDVGVACFTVFALYALWRLVRGGARRDAIWCGIGLGLALLAKYTGVVTAGLVPALVAGAWLISRWPRPELPALAVPSDPDPALASASEAAASAPEPAPPSAREIVAGPAPPVFAAPTLRQAVASLGVIVALALLLVALGFGAPSGISNYLRGFGRIYADANPRWEGFLWGEYSATGFRYYYLLASLWKTPLPTLIAFGVALTSLATMSRDRRLDWLFILLPFAAFHAAGVFNQANIGIRHVLPAYPFLFLACGAAAVRWSRAGWRGRIAMTALGLWLVTGTLRAHPHYLSYFNELAGGPEGGIAYLDDSNVEWGQDYWRLVDWVEERRPSNLAFWAFDPLPPADYGLRYRAIRLEDVTRPAPGVTYVVGAHYLQRNSLFNEWSGVRFEWLRRYRPVEIIGGSLYVYRFSIDAADEGSPDLVYLPPERWYADSIAQLTTILDRSPRFALARALLAADHVDRARWRELGNDPEGALLDLARAAEVAPREETARELGRALARLRPAIEAAALVGPGPWCLEGTYDRAGGHLGPAAIALVRCLATRPDDLAARANLGWTLLDLGLVSSARDELARCLEVDPAYGPALAGLSAISERRALAPGLSAEAAPAPAIATGAAPRTSRPPSGSLP